MKTESVGYGVSTAHTQSKNKQEAVEPNASETGQAQKPAETRTGCEIFIIGDSVNYSYISTPHI